MQTFSLPKGPRNLSRLIAFLSALSTECEWEVIVKRKQRTRSTEQNAYLWGVVYPTILRHMPGWDANDLHEYFLGEHFGWETLAGFGRKRLRPVRRSSKLKTTEFADYLAFVQRRAAEYGVYIPDANEEFRNVA